MSLYYFYTHYQLWQFQYWENWFCFGNECGRNFWIMNICLCDDDFKRISVWIYGNMPLYALDFLVSINSFLWFWQSWTYALTVNDRYGRVFSLSTLNLFIFKQFSFVFAYYFVQFSKLRINDIFSFMGWRMELISLLQRGKRMRRSD